MMNKQQILDQSQPCRVCRTRNKQTAPIDCQIIIIPCQCARKNRNIHRICFEEWVNTLWYKDHWQGDHHGHKNQENKQYQPINIITAQLHSLTCLNCRNTISVQGELQKKCRKTSQIQPINIFKLVGLIYLITIFIYFGVTSCQRAIKRDEGLGVFLWILFAIGFTIFIVILISLIIQTFWRNTLKNIKILNKQANTSAKKTILQESDDKLKQSEAEYQFQSQEYVQ